MAGSPRDIYLQNSDAFKLENEEIRSKLNRYSLIRLFLFLLSIVFLIFLLKEYLIISLVCASLSFMALILFVRFGSVLTSRKSLIAQLLRINEQEADALNWNYSGFGTGEEYTDPDHPNSSDLDLFGKGSLFQFLNRTSLSKGSDILAEWLRDPSPADVIAGRQEAVEELSHKLDWRQEFLARGRMSEESRQDYEQISKWLTAEPFLANRRGFLYLLYILPILTILSTALAFLWIPFNVPIFFVLVQLGIVALFLRQINHHHNQLSRKENLLRNFSELIGLAERDEFRAAFLVDIQARLSSSGISAGIQLKKLSRLVIQFDRRLNMIMAGVLNGLVMWDLFCVLRLERWKIANAREVHRWFDVLGELEAYNSLAGFRFNQSTSVFPVVSGTVLLRAESLGHPLIPEKESILNDIEITGPGEFLLVTGSNMSGKSTFLRTVGVNMVLAGAGAPVLARSMAWQPIRILSSMRIKDSLTSRESTFYAELKRLRMIIEVLKSHERVMILLDEILKGTNSRDKHFGSDMFIRQLLKEDCGGLIATHDLELSVLEKEFPGRLRNYCFEVQIEQQEFIFDYKLRQGVCKTLNATELMRKMGISINENARGDRPSGK